MRCIPLVLAACLIAAVLGQVQPPPPTSSSHRVCLHYSFAGVGTFYDITADNSQTVMKRYNTATNPPTLLDTNSYAALAMPNPAGSNFDVGVAFAAAMQTRNVWMYPATSQTSAAFWDVLGSDGDRWRFQTTQNGSPLVVTLATESCVGFNGGGSPPAQATPQPPAPQPTAAPVTAAPQTAAPPTSAAGSHRVCLTYSSGGVGTYYDITADASQTVMKRYSTLTNPPTLLDSNWYAALAMPNPAGSNFDVGVAFAATMQSRNVWMYPAESQTSAAYWDVLGDAGDRWRFQSSLNGEVTLATENCAGFNGGGSPPAQATPQPPAAEPSAAPQTAAPVTAAPVTAAPQTAAPSVAAGSHRVCLTYSAAGVGTYYDITADASQTVLRRYSTLTNPPTLLDTNTYAALAMPNPAGSNFDVGVAFAAAMQTRNVWMYSAESQTSAAFWDVLGDAGDRWRFQTTLNGAPLEVTLATETCLNF